jgi:thiamine-phosphate pyrophosphorylase
MGTLKGFPTSRDELRPAEPASARRDQNDRVGAVPRLYLITDRQATGGRPLADVVAAALRGVAGSGLPPDRVAVQLREKDLSGRALTALARTLRAITAAAGVGLYVNDRIDVALAVGADGVHLGGGSLDAGAAARVAPGLAIAVSAHGAEEIASLHAAAGGRLAFALLGPIRDTPSKRRFGAPLGTAAISAAARAGLPIVAVGGIGPAHVRETIAAGAHGVACIRAVMAAGDPALSVGTFCQQLTDAP